MGILRLDFSERFVYFQHVCHGKTSTVILIVIQKEVSKPINIPLVILNNSKFLANCHHFNYLAQLPRRDQPLARVYIIIHENVSYLMHSD